MDSSSAPPSYTEPAGKVNTSKLLTTGVLRATKGAPDGCQAPLDNRDLDFVAHLVEVKNHSKLKLNTAFFKSYSEGNARPPQRTGHKYSPK